MADYSKYFDIVEQLYIGYYQRPADPEGLLFWASGLASMDTDKDGTLEPGENFGWVLNEFANSAESRVLYGEITPLTIQTVVDQIYLNLFNRHAEADGLAFWVNGYNAGLVGAGEIVWEILNGAQNEDEQTVDNKTVAATRFTQTLDPELDGRPPFQATFSGTADNDAVRAWLAAVTWNGASIPSAEETYAWVQENIADPGDPILNYTTYNLTKDVDTINITGFSTDVVKGIVDGADSTFSTADTINGNGRTIVEVVAKASGTADYVEMSAVNQLKIVGAGATWLNMDASSYGTDISSIRLSGQDGLDVSVTNLAVQGDLDLSVAAAASGTIAATGFMDGVGYSFSVYNSDVDAVGANGTVGLAGIDIALGKYDTAYAYLYQTASKSAASVSVGDLTIGDVMVSAGQSASATISLSNWAYNKGNGTATAGDLTVGNLSADVGVNADVSMSSWYNAAWVEGTGDATVGSVTIGDINAVVLQSGDFYFEVYNSATTDKGNATAGDITIGTMTLDAGYGAYTNEFYAWNYAYADSGDATVGNITIGDITMTVGDNAASSVVDVEASNWASAQVSGNATAGNITIGNIDLMMGNSVDQAASAYFFFGNYATADSGDATTGNVTIGNVDFAIGSNEDFTFYATNEADTGKGAATVGNLTIGNITGSVGLSGYAWMGVYNMADGTAGDAAGNVTIGNIDMYGSANAWIGFSMTNSAEQGTLGNLTIGNVDMYVENSASISFSIQETANSIGDITIGDITFTMGSNANLEYFNISASADEGSVGNVTIGDITINAGISAYSSSVDGIYIWADDNIGAVTLGDLTVNAAKSATFTYLSTTMTADDGGITSITMGDIALTAGVNADIYAYQYFSADDYIGDITIGDVTLTAGEGGSATLSQTFYGDYADFGNITVGDITLSSGKSADAYYELYAYNYASFENFTYGNISVSAVGDNAWAEAYIWNSADDYGDMGDITVGTIDVTANGVGASASVTMYWTSANNMGDVTIGDIGVTASGSDATAQAYFYVSASEEMGNVTVGDVAITVNGSGAGVSAAYGSFSMDVYADQVGTVTVGDIDMILSNTAAAAAVTLGAYGRVDISVTANDAGGNTVIGDITLSAVELTDATIADTAKVTADFNIDTDGTLTVGDITVTGGYMSADGSPVVLDNFGTLTTWLDLTGKTITVGNVDYSDYESTATIDVSAWKGAANIFAAQDDTTITDNVTKNVITLGAGTDTVNILAGQTTDETSAAAIDQIIGFTHGDDLIQIDNATGAASQFAFKTAGLTDYASFLTWATAALADNTVLADVAVGVFGGNTFAAFDNDGNGTLDFAIELVGVTNVDAGDFNII